MSRRLGSGKLVIATHNVGKLKEIAALLAPYGCECISAGSLGLPEPAETGRTFVDNALIKARAAAESSGLPSLADDSGLSVAALDGRPGVWTADWAERQWFEGDPGRDWYMITSDGIGGNTFSITISTKMPRYPPRAMASMMKSCIGA